MLVHTSALAAPTIGIERIHFGWVLSSHKFQDGYTIFPLISVIARITSIANIFFPER